MMETRLQEAVSHQANVKNHAQIWRAFAKPAIPAVKYGESGPNQVVSH